MKKTLIILLVLITSLHGFAKGEKSKKINYNKIEKEIQKENSNLYYDSLMSRFLLADTTMSLREKRHLYYGYRYQPSYSPYGGIMPDSLRALMRQKSHTELDLFQIIDFCDTIITENPFDLSAYNYQLFAYQELGLTGKFDARLIQMWIIIDALLSSGDGLSQKTAFYVLFINHEYVLLNVLGFDFGGRQSLVSHFDVLQLAPNEDKIKEMFFDVSPSLESMTSMFK
jgi:hypothetical protein